MNIELKKMQVGIVCMRTKATQFSFSLENAEGRGIGPLQVLSGHSPLGTENPTKNIGQLSRSKLELDAFLSPNEPWVSSPNCCFRRSL
jgi:hypothetical protein